MSLIIYKCYLCTVFWYKRHPIFTEQRTTDIYIIYNENSIVRLASVGLTQAHPNYILQVFETVLHKQVSHALNGSK